MKDLFIILAGAVALGGYVPYAIDIIKGRARPARSARVMFIFLIGITLLQQRSLHSGSLIAFTLGEFIGSISILGLSIKNGVGGLSRLDIACYLLLIIDVTVWLTTGSALIAIHLSVMADLIAFTPTLAKTWRDPKSETPIYFLTGVMSPLLNILGTGKYSYAVLLFPVYLSLANLAETLIIVMKGKRGLFSTAKPTEPVI